MARVTSCHTTSESGAGFNICCQSERGEGRGGGEQRGGGGGGGGKGMGGERKGGGGRQIEGGRVGGRESYLHKHSRSTPTHKVTYIQLHTCPAKHTIIIR